MFSKFKLNDIVYSDFKEYESLGKEYYTKIQTDIQSSLKEFIGIDGVCLSIKKSCKRASKK